MTFISTVVVLVFTFGLMAATDNAAESITVLIFISSIYKRVHARWVQVLPAGLLAQDNQTQAVMQPACTSMRTMGRHGREGDHSTTLWISAHSACDTQCSWDYVSTDVISCDAVGKASLAAGRQLGRFRHTWSGIL